MIYNGIDLQEHFKKLTFSESILPEIENDIYRLAGSPGYHLRSRDLGSRYFNIEIEVEEDPYKGFDEQYSALANILYTDEPKPLIFHSNPSKVYYALVSSVSDINKLRHFGVMNIEFMCLDPFIYSANESIVENFQEKTIINSGAYPATGKMVIDINNSLNFLRVTNQKSGEFIYIEDSLKRGDEVLIDLENQLVKKNDHLIMNKLYLESDFFELPTGEFKITMSGGTGTLSFRERWL